MSLFESSVNPEGIQTVNMDYLDIILFESSVNPEGIQTLLHLKVVRYRLRVV